MSHRVMAEGFSESGHGKDHDEVVTSVFVKRVEYARAGAGAGAGGGSGGGATGDLGDVHWVVPVMDGLVATPRCPYLFAQQKVRVAGKHDTLPKPRVYALVAGITPGGGSLVIARAGFKSNKQCWAAPNTIVFRESAMSTYRVVGNTTTVDFDGVTVRVLETVAVVGASSTTDGDGGAARGGSGSGGGGSSGAEAGAVSTAPIVYLLHTWKYKDGLNKDPVTALRVISNIEAQKLTVDTVPRVLAEVADVVHVELRGSPRPLDAPMVVDLGLVPGGDEETV